MRLGIDLDGVVANFDATWIEQYNKQFGASIDPAEVTGWGALVTLTHFDEVAEFWEWARDFGGGSLFRHLEPYPEAIEALQALNNDGHDIVVLTAKPGWWAVHDTFAWLAEYKVPTREVHVLDRKWRVECDVYLDDAPHILRGLARNRPRAVICRYVRPWNRPVPGVIDVAEWDDFRRVVAESAATND